MTPKVGDKVVYTAPERANQPRAAWTAAWNWRRESPSLVVGVDDTDVWCRLLEPPPGFDEHEISTFRDWSARIDSVRVTHEAVYYEVSPLDAHASHVTRDGSSPDAHA